MVKQTNRWWRFLWSPLFAAGCGLGGGATIAPVTLDMRCGPTRDCPTGFSCVAEVDHEPPTTLCESEDPTTACPAGFETRTMYGQTFCKPPVSLGAPASRERAERARPLAGEPRRP